MIAIWFCSPMITDNYVFLPHIGTGCMAALEAEKWLAEQDGETEPDDSTEVKKGEPAANGKVKVPEYRSNPLL